MAQQILDEVKELEPVCGEVDEYSDGSRRDGAAAGANTVDEYSDGSRRDGAAASANTEIGRAHV